MQEVRFATLTLLAQHGPLTAVEVASRLGLRREAVSMCLLRARRLGLAQYDRRNGVHAISQRGCDRLAWLREHARGGSA